MVNILSVTMQYDNRKGLRITKLISKLKTLAMNLQTAIDTIRQVVETQSEPILGVTQLSDNSFTATQQIGDTVVNWYVEFNEAGNITTLK